jgi:hypothetical protein
MQTGIAQVTPLTGSFLEALSANLGRRIRAIALSKSCRSRPHDDFDSLSGLL